MRNLLPDNTVQSATLKPWTIGVTVTQTLFNGFKTANSVRVAELQVQSGREALRNVGQGVLLDAVTAYTNVLANQSLVEAQRSNVAFLRETLGDHPAAPQGRRRDADRYLAGRGAASPRPGRSQRRRSQSRRQPGDLYPGDRQSARRNCGRPKPWTAICRAAARSRSTLAFKGHPAVIAAGFDVDVASTTIRVAESSLMPTVTCKAMPATARIDDPTLGTFRTDQASVVGQIPRRSMTAAPRRRRPGRPRNSTAQSRLVLDQVRNQARTAATRRLGRQ